MYPSLLYSFYIVLAHDTRRVDFLHQSSFLRKKSHMNFSTWSLADKLFCTAWIVSKKTDNFDSESTTRNQAKKGKRKGRMKGRPSRRGRNTWRVNSKLVTVWRIASFFFFLSLLRCTGLSDLSFFFPLVSPFIHWRAYRYENIIKYNISMLSRNSFRWCTFS